MNNRLLAVLALLAASQAAAQNADAFVGTSKSILGSSICTRLAVCSPTGSAVVQGEKRTFYHLKLRTPTTSGLNEYDLYVATQGGVTTSVALLYPPAQDSVLDGPFRLAFFSAATGVRFTGQPPELAYSCTLLLRGAKTTFIVRDISIPGIGATSLMTVVMDSGKEGGMPFTGIPLSKKVSSNPAACR